MNTKHKYLTWAATALVAIALLIGGGANLAGVPLMHQSFAELGLPVWFGYLIGALLAERIGTDLTLEQLAKLPPDAVKLRLTAALAHYGC